MAKRILITCTDSMMKQFLEPHVRNLAEHGYEVEIACSEVLNRMAEVRQDLGHLVKIHSLSLARSPLARTNLRGYRELKELLRTNHYDLIWTNEPVMGIVTRLAAAKARKAGTKVLYMVHGFHFYHGAPLLNWLLFYPIERLMAPKADCICTINREDYARAQKMRTKKAAYIHGIGVDTARLQSAIHPGNQSKQTNLTNQTNQTDQPNPTNQTYPTTLRQELNLPDDAFLVLSVGELNENKNQQIILRAIAKINDPRIHYILCGRGDQKDALEALAKSLNIHSRIHFLGYRKDIADICRQCDVFALPSRREGLPLAALEAMYCGLPLINSNIRGLSDITEDGATGYLFSPDDEDGYARGILFLKNHPDEKRKMGKHNQAAVSPYLVDSVKTEVLSLVQDVLTNYTLHSDPAAKEPR